jgi:hypothetical protein
MAKPNLGSGLFCTLRHRLRKSMDVTGSAVVDDCDPCPHETTPSIVELMIASLRYLDTFAKIDGSWYFAERKLVLDWSETRPSTAGP